jgi:hypothetical protein
LKTVGRKPEAFAIRRQAASKPSAVLTVMNRVLHLILICLQPARSLSHSNLVQSQATQRAVRPLKSTAFTSTTATTSHSRVGHNKLKVQFNGEWMTRGGYPNIVKPSRSHDEESGHLMRDTKQCKITMTFLKNKMKVEQEGLDAEVAWP